MTIRIETDGASDLSRMAAWMARHRGGVVRLDGGRRVALGNPISGARSVIIAAVVQDDGHSDPRLGGVVRALANRTEAEPVRLVFEGRSPAGLARPEAEAVAAEILERISELAHDDRPMAEVA